MDIKILTIIIIFTLIFCIETYRLKEYKNIPQHKRLDHISTISMFIAFVILLICNPPLSISTPIVIGTILYNNLISIIQARYALKQLKKDT